MMFTVHVRLDRKWLPYETVSSEQARATLGAAGLNDALAQQVLADLSAQASRFYRFELALGGLKPIVFVLTRDDEFFLYD